MSQKAPTIKLGGAPYEDAMQASTLQNIRSRKLVKKQEETRRDFTRRTWASYATGQISRRLHLQNVLQVFTSTLVVGSYHA